MNMKKINAIRNEVEWNRINEKMPSPEEAERMIEPLQYDGHPMPNKQEALSKPTVPEVMPLLRKYAAKPGNSAGGSLHIVIHDGNVDVDSVLYCIKFARERADRDGVELGGILLRMSLTQLRKLYKLF